MYPEVGFFFLFFFARGKASILNLNIVDKITKPVNSVA